MDQADISANEIDGKLNFPLYIVSNIGEDIDMIEHEADSTICGNEKGKVGTGVLTFPISCTGSNRSRASTLPEDRVRR